MKKNTGNHLVEMALISQTSKDITSPSLYCRRYGLKSMRELSQESGFSESTLNNWFKYRRRSFDRMLYGCLVSRLFKDIIPD